MHSLLIAIKNEILKEKTPIDVNEELYILSKESHIAPFLYRSCSDNTPDDIKKNLKKELISYIMYDEVLKSELEQIKELLNENNIQYSCLKGYNLKKLYPETYLRYMCDFDILIHKSDLKKIIKIFEVNGFKKGIESDHDVTMVNANCHIEFHYRLISKKEHGSKLFKSPFRMMTRIANSYEYVFLKREDEYLFYFFHTLKHFEEKGIGIRNFIDLYLFFHSYNLNIGYVHKCFRYTEFYDDCIFIQKFVECFFEDTLENQKFIECILQSKTYGTFDDEIKNELKRISVKKWIIKRLFPSPIMMINYYPFLRNKWMNIFLPLLYIHRIFYFSIIKFDYSKKKISKVIKFAKNKKKEKN